MIATSISTFIFKITCIIFEFKSKAAHDAYRAFAFTAAIGRIVTVIIVLTGTVHYSNVHADIAF